MEDAPWSDAASTADDSSVSTTLGEPPPDDPPPATPVAKALMPVLQMWFQRDVDEYVWKRNNWDGLTPREKNNARKQYRRIMQSMAAAAEAADECLAGMAAATEETGEPTEIPLPEGGTAENLASVCECIWCATFPDYCTADGTAENLASVCGLHLVRRVLCHALCDAFGAMRSGCVRLRR